MGFLKDEVNIKVNREDLAKVVAFSYMLAKDGITKLANPETLKFEDKVLVSLYNVLLALFHILVLLEEIGEKGVKSGVDESFYI